MSQHKLVIAEKPSVAGAIAAVLGAKECKDGCICGNGWVVTWCVGHLVELAQASAYDERYAKWRQEDLPILPKHWQYTAAQGKKKQLDILRSLMNDKTVASVVCATDAGREGELIFRLVYDYCKCTKPVERLWISSMEDTAIREGFRKLRPGIDYDNLYRAALCRSQADWMVGINATRFFSCLYGVTLNVGRVQTPTLALLVEREAAIAAFVKEPFYTPTLNLGGFTASSEKLKDRATADAVCSACDGKEADIREVKRQNINAVPPKLYDLTTLQREANRLFGYTAQQTLDYTQSLYEKKLCTYPRTDSRFLTEDMASGIPALASAVAGKLTFLPTGLSLPVDAGQVINNSKVTDHHAIIPTPTVGKTDLDTLPAGERNILHLLAVRLLCAVGEKHSYAETVVTVECVGHSFTAKGKTVQREGWKAVEQAFRITLKETSQEDESDGTSLPELPEGRVFSPVAASVREGFSSPPKHFSEDTLLSSMESTGTEDMPEEKVNCPAGAREATLGCAERKGLRTPATRAGIIEKLVKSGFVERRSKQLFPTQKGANLIAILPDTVKSPLLTAEWEHKLKQIERGELTDADFMEGIAPMTTGLISAHAVPDTAHSARFSRPSGHSVGPCPRCGCTVIESKKGFFCLGNGCKFALWRDNKFFAAKKKEVTTAIAAALLTEGRVFMKGLYSEKIGKTYDATVVLEDTGQYVNFKLDFDRRKTV